MSNPITILVQMQAEFSQFKQQFEQVSQMVEKFGKLGGVAATAFKILSEGLAVGALAESIRHVTESVAEAEEEMGKLTEKTGLTSQVLSGLARQGVLVGVPLAEMNVGLGMFADKVFLAARQGGVAAQAFRDLGVALTNADGALLPTDQILERVAERFKDLPDGPMKAALATELFGRAGRELIPVLNQGAEGIQRLREQGGGIQPEDIEKAKAFKEAQREVQLEVAASSRGFVNSFLPALTECFKAIGEIISETHLLDIAFGAVASVIKIFAAGFVVATEAVRLLGTTIGYVAAAAFEAIKGNFGAAKDILGQLGHEIGDQLTHIKEQLTNILDPGAMEKVKKQLGASEPLTFSAESKRKLAQAAAESDLKVIEDSLKTRAEREKVAYDAGLVALAEYTKQRSAVLLQGYEQEADIIAREVERINTELQASPAGSAERADLLAQRTKLISQSNSLKEEYKRAMLALDAEVAAKQKETLESLAKRFAETTQGKLAQLAIETRIEKEGIDKNVADVEEVSIAKLNIDTIAERKRTEILRQQADARAEIEMAAVLGRRHLVESDPTRAEADKKSELLKLLNQEHALLASNIAIKERQVSDPAVNDEARLEAAKQLQDLRQKQAENEIEIGKVSRKDTFAGESQDAAIQALNDWGSLAHQTVTSFTTFVKDAFSSIGDGITGLIMGTKTWGQALTQIYNTVVTDLVQSFVKMGLEWVRTHIVMQAFSRIFRTTETTEQAAHTAAQTGMHAAGEETKTATTGANVLQRGFLRATETVWHGIQVGLRTAAHVAGEIYQTAVSAIHATLRVGYKIFETTVSIIQTGIKVATHIAGELLMSAVSAAQSAIRIGYILVEALVWLVQAAFKGASAVADIPYVGPVLAIAAMAAIVAAGLAIAGAFEDGGRPAVGKVALVGERGPELFIPDRQGTVIPADVTADFLRSQAGGKTQTADGGSRQTKIDNRIHLHTWGSREDAETFIRSASGRHLLWDTMKQEAEYRGA